MLLPYTYPPDSLEDVRLLDGVVYLCHPVINHPLGPFHEIAALVVCLRHVKLVRLELATPQQSRDHRLAIDVMRLVLRDKHLWIREYPVPLLPRRP